MKDRLTNREKRRRRRIRNQIFAYLTLLVLIFVVLAAGYIGVKSILGYVRSYNDRVNKAIEEAESEAAGSPDEAQQDTAVQQEGMPETIPEGYVPTETGSDPLDNLIEAFLDDMTTEEMVAGMFMISPEALTGVGQVVKAGDSTKEALTAKPVGGLVYSDRNFQSADQFTQMLAGTQEFIAHPLFTAVKAECGSDTGFGIETTPKASDLTDTAQVTEIYGEIAGKLAGYGVNMNLAPVAEAVSEEGDASLQGRVFGSDAATVAPLVNAAAQVMQTAGVSAVLQKFPGTGTGAKSLEELKNSEFIIYDMAIKNGVDCIMVTNAGARGVTGDDTPCSLSSVMITDVLRNTLGFQGIVMTDYLNADSITADYTAAEAAVAAIQAGADIILEPEDYEEAYAGVMQAVADGTISKERIRESVYRIFRVKYRNALDAGTDALQSQRQTFMLMGKKQGMAEQELASFYGKLAADDIWKGGSRQINDLTAGDLDQKEGKNALQCREYLSGEGGNSHCIGDAVLVFAWDEAGKCGIADWRVEGY